MGRGARRSGELIASIAAALALGVLATALDFGGWNELDWRPSLLALLGGFAAAGFVRAIRLARRGDAAVTAAPRSRRGRAR